LTTGKQEDCCGGPPGASASYHVGEAAAPPSVAAAASEDRGQHWIMRWCSRAGGTVVPMLSSPTRWAAQGYVAMKHQAAWRTFVLRYEEIWCAIILHDFGDAWAAKIYFQLQSGHDP
jgi:hypothetical protein